MTLALLIICKKIRAPWATVHVALSRTLHVHERLLKRPDVSTCFAAAVRQIRLWHVTISNSGYYPGPICTQVLHCTFTLKFLGNKRLPSHYQASWGCVSGPNYILLRANTQNAFHANSTNNPESHKETPSLLGSLVLSHDWMGALWLSQCQNLQKELLSVSVDASSSNHQI